MSVTGNTQPFLLATVMMNRSRSLLLALLVLIALPAATAAQTVLVRVVNGEGGAPLVGAIAYLVNADGSTLRNGLTDERGRALFVGVPAGEYRIRGEMIGMATAETASFSISEGATITEELRLESSAIQLEGIEVEMEAGRCSVRPSEGLLVASVWDEARKALSAASLTDETGAYRYETMQYDRQLSREGVMLDEQQRRREGYMLTPFESRPAEDLAENGYVQRDGRDFIYFAPDASVLLSDAFLDTHCFKVADAGSGNPDGFVGLGFEPTGERKSVPDIGGTMWIHPETAELQWLDFDYRYLDPDMTSDQVGGRVAFERLPSGTWIVPEWWIRMPVMTSQTDFEGRARPYILQYHQTGGMVTEVREAGGRSLGQRVQTGGIEGVVRDSLGVPLRGVRIGVVGSNQEVYSNADGEFSITGLTEGRFQVRFVDAQLEQAGYIPEPVTRDVIVGEMTAMEFHMPSIGDVLFEACRGVEREQGSVLLAGMVVDSRGRPAPGVTVRATWRGYTVVGGGGINPVEGDISGLTEQTNGFEATASDTGFFRFCGVPPNTEIELYAASGTTESERYEVQIPDWETGALRVLELPRN